MGVAPMDQEREPAQWQAYRKTYRSFAAKVERRLIEVAVLVLVALVVIQGLMAVPRGERLLSLAAFLEGEPQVAVTSWLGAAQRQGQTALAPGTGAPWGQPSLTLQVEGGGQLLGLRLLVNGQVRGDFGTGSLTLAVREGERLTLEGAGLKGKPTIVVTGAAGIRQPKLGARVTLTDGQAEIGRVVLRP
jgi:hypothetical protein